MRFYQRLNGVIVADYANRQGGLAEEGLLDSHPDVVAYRNPSPTSEMVIAERGRRLAMGFDFDFGDARGVHHIGTTTSDMEGWDEVTKFANALVNLSDTTTLITAVTTTGPVEITGLEWQQILVAAAQFRQPIWAASFALQSMAQIPTDFADDAYWPAT